MYTHASSYGVKYLSMEYIYIVSLLDVPRYLEYPSLLLRPPEDVRSMVQQLRHAEYDYSPAPAPPLCYHPRRSPSLSLSLCPP